MKRRGFLKSGAAAAAGLVTTGAASQAATNEDATSTSASVDPPIEAPVEANWPSMPLPRFKIADGPFEPNWDSLRAGYTCPDWFRDAKFGLWAHWGMQSQAQAGDWYTRNMYLQGRDQYNHHVKKFGHPTEHGVKDLACAWKADRFDPDGLMRLYKEAGAKYFTFMVNHHDNFDSWDSKYQPWNSVNVGPKKDLCRMWAEAARKQGLRFGATFHNTPYRCWNTFMPRWYASDDKGPKQGQPYDGATVTKADGKGTPWEGLDPRDLYGPVHEANTPCPAFVRQFLLRVDDLLRNYQPDLLYFDDSTIHLLDAKESIKLSAMLGMPDLIPQIAAHYYNLSRQWHGGKADVVLNIKHAADIPITEQTVCSALVNDFEVKDPGKPFEFPWQTDTTLGSWHYRDGDRYRSTTSILHNLITVVANNGNLLLNIAPRGDGTIDDRQRRTVEEIGDWMHVNGEAIYATRPWRVAKEGRLRFTRNKAGDALYAISLEWPKDGKLVIKPLAGEAEKVRRVELLGHDGPLKVEPAAGGLVVDLPANKPCGHAYAVKIVGPAGAWSAAA